MSASPTLDDILAIPHNQNVFKELQTLVTAGKAIAFAGAGASAPLYPLWGKLIADLCDRALKQDYIKKPDRDFLLSFAESKPTHVVREWRRLLSPVEQAVVLRDIFGEKVGADGRRHTPVQAALMRAPFARFITTNYDPGLLDARMRLRPNVSAVGWTTWKNPDELQTWKDSANRNDRSCPILFAHGFYQDVSTIILGLDEYRTAYQPGQWRRCFEYLWEFYDLVFVGFGFSDSFLDFVVNELFAQTENRANSAPRHVAFLPVGAAEGYSDERRKFYARTYGARVIFYPVVQDAKGRSDHSALLTLLDALAPAMQATATVSVVLPIAPAATLAVAVARPFPAQWVHETTNDQYFDGRAEEIARLDRWVADPTVRLIGVSAVGGTGKTALVGHWLKNTAGWRTLRFAGLFAWSFYQESDTTMFLKQFLDWAHAELDAPEWKEGTPLVEATLRILWGHPLVVVLDGLEVLQQAPGVERHGAFLDDSLREFLHGLCEDGQSLGVLTSRFVFPDLQRHLGTHFHQRELSGLAPEAGAQLLRHLAVRGPVGEREEVSRRLEGHPLGLRVFADALLPEHRPHPLDFLTHAFTVSQLAPDAPLTGKIQRLLAFYQKRLPGVHVQLLEVLAIFRSPVSEDNVIRLVEGLHACGNEATLATELKKLHARGIISREPMELGFGYACHPILRDHFRGVLLASARGIARKAVDLIAGRPAQEEPKSVKELEPVLAAVELLLAAHELDAANELIQVRLHEARVFKWLAVPHLGLTCMMQFLESQPLQQRPELHRFYVHKAATFAGMTGAFDQALELRKKADDLARQLELRRHLAIGLRDRSDMLIHRGELTAAFTAAKESLEITRQISERLHEAFSLGLLAFVATLQGQLSKLPEILSDLHKVEGDLHFQDLVLSGIRGIQFAESLYLLCRTDFAEALIHRVLSLSETEDRRADQPRAKRVLALIRQRQCRVDDAQNLIAESEKLLRLAGMLPDLARSIVTAGQFALIRKDVVEAQRLASEALDLAQPRGLLLVQADALLLRGQAHFQRAAEEAGNARAGEHTTATHALDDGEDALRLARETGYAWAERDALALLTDTYATLAAVHEKAGDQRAATRAKEESRRHRQEADVLSANLRVTVKELDLFRL